MIGTLHYHMLYKAVYKIGMMLVTVDSRIIHNLYNGSYCGNSHSY